MIRRTIRGIIDIIRKIRDEIAWARIRMESRTLPVASMDYMRKSR